MATGLLSSHQKSLDFLQRSCDLILLTATWVVFAPAPTLLHGIAVLTLTAVIFQLSAALTGLYGSQRSTPLALQFWRVSLTGLTAFLAMALTAYFLKPIAHALPPRAMTEWLLSSLILLCNWRLLYRWVLLALRRRGLNTRRAGIVGSNGLANDLIERLNRNPWMGIVPVLRYAGHDGPDLPNGLLPRRTLLADARSGRLDIIYLAQPPEAEASTRALLDDLADTTCQVFLVPDFFVRDLLHSRQDNLDGLPVISLYDTPFTASDLLLKRGLDLVVSCMALVLLSPVLAGFGLAVRLTSPGPALFKQTRYGLNGRPISVFKFRSMTTQDNGSEIRQATRNDPRITPLGAFMRRTSIDELPQFLNVLMGDMSVVGPRPHAVAHNELYRQQIPGYMLRHKVKPGITGWAQVNGYRGETDTLDKMEKRIAHDLEYIRGWSLWLDIRIIWRTALGGLRSDNAY